MKVLGWDIGGANLKVAWIEVSGGRMTGCQTAVRYLPLWRGGKERLPAALQEIFDSLSGGATPDGIGVAVTAELSDVFESKREGVEYVLQSVRQTSRGVDPLVVDYNGDLAKIEAALTDHLRFSSANWAATARILAGIFADCVLIDVGSTTTDIVPVLNHRVASVGRTDPERLAAGELVYTGALRSSIPSITHVVPVNGRETEVAAERFALSADVHLLLRNISLADYSTETADGRDTLRERCLERLARTVCADPEMIGEAGLIQMASYVYDRQVEKIRGGLEKVLGRLGIKVGDHFPVVTTGLGGEFLGREAARRSGFRRFLGLDEVIGANASQAAAAVSVALLVAADLGERVEWPRF